MMKVFKMIFLNVLIFALFQHGFGQFVQVGSGGYTTVFPGVDIAGRNTFPSGTPFLSGDAFGKPVPTNDWYSAVIKTGQASNLFNYPFTMKTISQGLVVTYIPFGPIDDIQPVIVGVSGLSANSTTISNHSDWAATFDWNDGNRNFKAASGIGMPFLYFTKDTGDVAQITVNSGSVTVSDEMIIIMDARNGADFAVYAPTGSTWSQSGNVYTSDLNGKNYWSLAFIPLTAPNAAAVAEDYKQYAYVFPSNTTASYNYDENTSVVHTDFEVETDVKEGSNTNMLLGLLPHQWANLAAGSPMPEGYSYATIRGEMKTLCGNSFSVENTFHGVLPTLPYVDFYSEGFSPFALTEKVESLENTVMAEWTDSYNEGQVFNMLLQTARIADLTGNIESRDKIIATIKNRIEDWLLAEPQEVAFLFYYNSDWSAMIGYPAGHGQDGGLNDHHFHWGYFIQACTFIEQYNPGWAEDWGGMVNLLVRDAASDNRNDEMFPFLRNFSPYAGHSWADGFAGYPQGNNQESSSESMVFASALINWGAVIGNDEIRDLGIYLYTTEYTGIEEYYMDMHERNFPPTQQYALISRLWGNAFDNQTFWTGDLAASYGIEIYPIQGGSLYLGINNDYAELLWDEVAANTGILFNEENPNLWHDEWWKFRAFTNAEQAIEMYNSFPGRQLKFGVSDAQTYHWVHAMNALGRVNPEITANYPIAATFSKDGIMNYVANNYLGEPITVTFSDGFQLEVPARKMATSMDCAITGMVSTPFGEAYPGGSIVLDLGTSGGDPTKVEFMDGTQLLGTLTAPPYAFTANDLQLGMHSFYAKIYDGERLNISNTVKVRVGEQYPWGGSAMAIPGTIDAGNYDFFIGGKGQNITYYDATNHNEGNYRTNESVDAFQTPNEGATVGYIAPGEWLEFSVDVAEAGFYSMSFRYASNNQAGGGPFHIEADGIIIAENITIPTTNGWDIWATKTVGNIPLTPGSQTFRLAFSNGEFNLGQMTFTRTGDLDFSYPLANAGEDFKVVLPQNTGTLDGSASSESGGNALSYNWLQIYGPSVASISDQFAVNPSISGLTEGIYKFELTVTNPQLLSHKDEVLVMVTPFENAPPQVSLISPANNTTFTEGNPVSLSALASDFDGTIQKVEFFKNDTLITTVAAPPYLAEWNPSQGNYAITAKATDNIGAVATSQPSQVTIAPLMFCSGTSTEAMQGSFTDGYIWSYETVGSNVIITFELLDEKDGVVAYLWKENPFSELQMTHVEGRKFTATITGQTMGTTISYACKFAFAGGMSVTPYIEYEVGSNCNTSGVFNINITPLSFYPNPSTSEIFISNPDGEAVIKIYDLWGNQLIGKISFENIQRIDVSSLKKGVYIIRLENKNTIQTARMIRQ
jgi:endo-1,3(4)-beta-glucanase